MAATYLPAAARTRFAAYFGLVCAELHPLSQAVKVWDARQSAAVITLPNWHTNAINTIK
jgi:hypothetical protein